MPKRAYRGFSQIDTDLLTKKSLDVEKNKKKP